jgi:hypothetical protein
MIQRTFSTPKKSIAKSELRKIDDEKIIPIMAWMADNLKGNVWWEKTQFRDFTNGRTPTCHNRKRHFNDGYWVYNFWFSRKADAALFKIWWMM